MNLVNFDKEIKATSLIPKKTYDRLFALEKVRTEKAKTHDEKKANMLNLVLLGWDDGIETVKFPNTSITHETCDKSKIYCKIAAVFKMKEQGWAYVIFDGEKKVADNLFNSEVYFKSFDQAVEAMLACKNVESSADVEKILVKKYPEMKAGYAKLNELAAKGATTMETEEERVLGL